MSGPEGIAGGNGFPSFSAFVIARMFAMASRSWFDWAFHLPSLPDEPPNDFFCLNSFLTCLAPSKTFRRSSPSKPSARLAAMLKVFRCFFGAHFGQQRWPWILSMRSRAVPAIFLPQVVQASSNLALAAPSGTPLSGPGLILAAGPGLAWRLTGLLFWGDAWRRDCAGGLHLPSSSSSSLVGFHIVLCLAPAPVES